MDSAVFLSIMLEILSGPEAVLFLQVGRSEVTSSTVQVMVERGCTGDSVVTGAGEEEVGEKQEEKKKH